MLRADRIDAAGMIRVMVGQQKTGQTQVAALKELQRAGRFAWINQYAVLVIVHGPDIII